MNDLLSLIRSWRTYRYLATMDEMPKAHYQRLVDDYALIIRRRLGR
mgnify:CR=1 FL=1